MNVFQGAVTVFAFRVTGIATFRENVFFAHFCRAIASLSGLSGAFLKFSRKVLV